MKDSLYVEYKDRSNSQLILNKPENSDNATDKPITWWVNIEKFDKKDFGDYLGSVLSGNDSNTFVSHFSDLVGAKIYIYKPMDCEAILIAKKDDMCSLFKISPIAPNDYTISDIFDVYGVNSGDQIENVQVISKETLFSENSGDVKENSSSISSREKIQEFYNAVLSLTKSSPEETKKAPLVDKNGGWLFYQFAITLTNDMNLYMNYEPSTDLFHTFASTTLTQTAIF